MPDTTPRHRLPYILPAQAQKHVTHNESIRLLDLLTNLHLVAMDMIDPPDEPADGACHALGASPEGAWAGHPGCIAAWIDGAWLFVEPFAGLRALCAEHGGTYVHDGSGWRRCDLDPGSLPYLGINTIADLTNRLAVKSGGVLFSHDDQSELPQGDIRVALNKSSPNATGSLVFQTAYSGRVELGCTGSDDLTIRTSIDGTIFQTAMTMSSSTGFLGLGGSPDHPLVVRKDLDGQVARIQGRNSSTSAGSGASLLLTGGTSQAQLLQYAAGPLYLMTNGSALHIQATGANSTVRIWASGVQALSASSNRVEFATPVRLQQYAVAALPSAATSGAGALAYVTNESGGAVVAFSDGSIWRRMTDRAPVIAA